MSRQADFDLEADDIITAAVQIFRESGLDAVSMRSVATRLGVSPVPLYSRIGNKDALVDAIADRLFANVTPPRVDDETWDSYAARWAGALRSQLVPAEESRLILSLGREAFVEVSRPLVDAMRHDGFRADAAVQACRLLMWATVGFVAVESGARPPRRPRPVRPGGDAGGIDAAEVDTLFNIHIRHLIDGIARDTAVERRAARR
ncbi:MAG: TetR/AcrR family transcriptional regulator, tetracycline repressor protein [Actinomycetota bacterium]|nr:TetR/AcrR family transcriptional regulator, tetracycline repressor protein [Actinomycetota bacterium]